MNINKRFFGRKKKIEQYKNIAEKLNLQCEYCKGYSQTIQSICIGEAVISCNNCGNIWSKEIEENYNV